MSVTLADIQALMRTMEISQNSHVLCEATDGRIYSFRREEVERDPSPARLPGDAHG